MFWCWREILSGESNPSAHYVCSVLQVPTCCSAHSLQPSLPCVFRCSSKLFLNFVEVICLHHPLGQCFRFQPFFACKYSYLIHPFDLLLFTLNQCPLFIDTSTKGNVPLYFPPCSFAYLDPPRSSPILGLNLDYTLQVG